MLLGLAMHTFFDGIAIGSGFVVSQWLGWVLFFAVFLHKIPEGFTVASVMLAGGQGRRAALNSALLLGATTVLGVLAISLQPSLGAAGVAAVGGSDDLCGGDGSGAGGESGAGDRMALVFFAGVVVFFLLRLLVPA